MEGFCEECEELSIDLDGFYFGLCPKCIKHDFGDVVDFDELEWSV